ARARCLSARGAPRAVLRQRDDRDHAAGHGDVLPALRAAGRRDGAPNGTGRCTAARRARAAAWRLPNSVAREWRASCRRGRARGGRRCAADSIGLRAGESFTLYTDIGRDTLVLVLSGAYRDRLVPYTWWFPVVGRVPYKGFFAFDAARAATEDMRRAGYDAYLRPSPAFSTLGWFNDPLLNTTLLEDRV